MSLATDRSTSAHGDHRPAPDHLVGDDRQHARPVASAVGWRCAAGSGPGRSHRRHVLLFAVFVGAASADAQGRCRAGRSSGVLHRRRVYGWWRWRQARAARGGQDDRPAIRRASRPGASGRLLLASAAGTLALRGCSAWSAPLSGPALEPLAGRLHLRRHDRRDVRAGPRLVEFWFAWLAVDVVGVPLLSAHGYYPSAVVYVVYGALVLWGFAGVAEGVQPAREHAPSRRTVTRYERHGASAPARPRRAGHRRHRRRPRRSWSSTTRTARTRATSIVAAEKAPPRSSPS